MLLSSQKPNYIPTPSYNACLTRGHGQSHETFQNCSCQSRRLYPLISLATSKQALIDTHRRGAKTGSSRLAATLNSRWQQFCEAQWTQQWEAVGCSTRAAPFIFLFSKWPIFFGLFFPGGHFFSLFFLSSFGVGNIFSFFFFGDGQHFFILMADRGNKLMPPPQPQAAKALAMALV